MKVIEAAKKWEKKTNPISIRNTAVKIKEGKLLSVRRISQQERKDSYKRHKKTL